MCGSTGNLKNAKPCRLVLLTLMKRVAWIYLGQLAQGVGGCGRGCGCWWVVVGVGECGWGLGM